jgi:hypothetical protein
MSQTLYLKVCSTSCNCKETKHPSCALQCQTSQWETGSNVSTLYDQDDIPATRLGQFPATSRKRYKGKIIDRHCHQRWIRDTIEVTVDSRKIVQSPMEGDVRKDDNALSAACPCVVLPCSAPAYNPRPVVDYCCTGFWRLCMIWRNLESCLLLKTYPSMTSLQIVVFNQCLNLQTVPNRKRRFWQMRKTRSGEEINAKRSICLSYCGFVSCE